MATAECIRPTGHIAGTVRVPGDKSIAHRALILGAIASSAQTITGLPEAEDVGSTLGCLRALGCRIEETGSETRVFAMPSPADNIQLDAGNSGTTARLLAGLVAGLGVNATIDGDESLRRRPMRRVAEPLVRMGAKIETSAKGTLPLRLRPSHLHGIEYELPVASAQVKSALLLAGLFASAETTIMEPAPTRDHTERMLEAMGVGVERTGTAVRITGGARPAGMEVEVPGDFSSAAFFIVAAAGAGGHVRLPAVGVNPTRTGLLDTMQAMGATVVRDNKRNSGGESQADLSVQHSPLRGVTIDDPAQVAAMIDELPLLAVLATRAEGTTVVRGAEELRHKECDRIDAIVRNLSAMGAKVDEFEDGFAVHGPCALEGAGVDGFGDHRIAMSMGVAALFASGETTITGADAVRISYPGFFAHLRGLTHPEGSA